MQKLKLYAHQKEGLKRAIKSSKGHCLFHGTGTGKTITSLAIIQEVIKVIPKHIVICRKELINAAWMHDNYQHFGMRMLNCHKISKRRTVDWYIDQYDIFVLNYESARTDRFLRFLLTIAIERPSWLYLDEATAIKEPSTKNFASMIQLAGVCRKTFPLTGTAINNNLLDIYAPIRAVDPCRFPQSFHYFKKSYFNLERTNWHGKTTTINLNAHDKKLTRLGEHLRAGFRFVPKNHDELLDKVSDLIHWVRKADCLDLPDQVIIDIPVELSKKEVEMINQIKNSKVIQEDNAIVSNALTELMKLRQASSGFVYKEGDGIIRTGHSKTSVVRDLIYSLGGEQVIIWVNFQQEEEDVVEVVTKLGLRPTTLTGQTKDKDESIERFKQGEVDVLVANPASAAYGLTFNNCSYQIFYSLSFNREHYVQALDRNHRIGQDKKCVYYRLISDRGIDKVICDNLLKKEKIAWAVFQYCRNKGGESA